MENSLRIMQLASRMAEIGNQNSLSDAGVAVLQAQAGLEGAAMNVLINIPGIEDKKIVADFEQKVASLRSDAKTLAETILAVINTKLTTQNS